MTERWTRRELLGTSLRASAVKAKGRLWIDGFVPLEPAGDGSFWLNEPPHNPGRIEFFNRVAGKCMHAKLSGEDFWRVFLP